jgi:putative membrane protein
MSDDRSSNEMAEERTEWAESRTDWAEDRTLMANERTFAGWMRTGMAALGIGLGFNALFGKLEPFWFPRAIASCFIIIGIFIFWAAHGKGVAVQKRLAAHQAEPIKSTNLTLIAGLMSLGGIMLLVGIWVMEVSDFVEYS